jgi:2-oxo-4-hydroxy-4-carboxy-5-ureidoimidazoline decarboxylase
MTPAELNELPADDARASLARCCAAPRWIEMIVEGRPYGDVDAVLARSDATVAVMTPDDLRAALAGHPRIGEPPAASADFSAREQAGVSADDAALVRELADGNAAYEDRFGHIYLVCATGRSGPELLALLRERLGNEPETEWLIVAAELAKINRIRLAELLGASP